MKIRYGNCLLFASSVFGLAAAAAAQQADQATAESGGGDIVVTAQKRSETLQNVPISITAITGDAMASRGQDEFSKFSKSIPSLPFIASGPGHSQLSIRGGNTGARSDERRGGKECVSTGRSRWSP